MAISIPDHGSEPWARPDSVLQSMGLDPQNYETPIKLSLNGPIRGCSNGEPYDLGSHATLLIRTGEPRGSRVAGPDVPYLLLHARVLLVGMSADREPVVLVVA